MSETDYFDELAEWVKTLPEIPLRKLVPRDESFDALTATYWEMIRAVGQYDLQNWEELAAKNGEVINQLCKADDGNWDTKKSEPFDAGPRPHVPVELVELRYVQFESNFGEIKALVKCDDGIKRACTYQSKYYPGDMINEPETDETLSWEDGTGGEIL